MFQFTPPCRGRPRALPKCFTRLCFNSRPRAGGDTFRSPTQRRCTGFQFTPPCRGRRPTPCRLPRSARCFNSRPRAGGDLPASGRRCVCKCFNSRPRAGGDFCRSRCLAYQTFQFTPPCRGRLSAIAKRRNGHTVSIHAPVQGATSNWRKGELLGRVSIHAPVQGATAGIAKW